MAKKRASRPPVDGEGGLNGGNGGVDPGAQGQGHVGAITSAAAGEHPLGKQMGTRPVRTGGRLADQDPATSGERDNGERETISRAVVDKVWTADSKERWGDGQPSPQDLLKEKRKIDAAVEGRDPPAEEEEAEEEEAEEEEAE